MTAGAARQPKFTPARAMAGYPVSALPVEPFS